MYLTVGCRSWILEESLSVVEVLDNFPPTKKTSYVS